MFCLVGFYCCNAEIQKYCEDSTKVHIADTGLKCRQCGKNLKHKGFFCSESCRQNYSNEYHNERYGKAICRNCGKEFVQLTDCAYFCSSECWKEYYSDLKLVSEAEEYRKSKENNEMQ